MTVPAIIACGDAPCSDPVKDRSAVVAGLCSDPELLMGSVGSAERLVMVLHQGQYDLSAVQTALRAAEIDPLGVEILDQDELGDDAQRTTVILAGAAARAGAFGGSDPEHAKPVFPRALTRRRLLRWPALEYAAVPRVDTEICEAERGCRTCTLACPYEALRWANGTILFEKGSCEACGRCITACPTGAVKNPAADPQAVANQVLGMVAAAGGPIGLAFTCRRGGNWQAPPGWFEVEVPCVGMVPGTWIVALLLLGASSGAAIPCADSGCPLDGDGRAAAAVELAELMLAAAGVDPRLATATPGGPPTPFDISVPLEQPFGARGPAEVALALAVAAGEGCLAPVGHRHSPLGIVEVDRAACTLCMQCAGTCPTAALAADRADTTLQLTFNPQLCTACGGCLTVCPEIPRGAIRLTAAIDVDDLSRGRRVLNEAVATSCESCGRAVAPEPMVGRIAELLGPGHATMVGYLSRRCMDCRTL